MRAHRDQAVRLQIQARIRSGYIAVRALINQRIGHQQPRSVLQGMDPHPILPKQIRARAFIGDFPYTLLQRPCKRAEIKALQDVWYDIENVQAYDVLSTEPGSTIHYGKAVPRGIAVNNAMT